LLKISLAGPRGALLPDRGMALDQPGPEPSGLLARRSDDVPLCLGVGEPIDVDAAISHGASLATRLGKTSAKTEKSRSPAGRHAASSHSFWMWAFAAMISVTAWPAGGSGIGPRFHGVVLDHLEDVPVRVAEEEPLERRGAQGVDERGAPSLQP